MNGIVEKDKNPKLNHNVVFAREGLNLGKNTAQIILIVSFKVF